MSHSLSSRSLSANTEDEEKENERLNPTPAASSLTNDPDLAAMTPLVKVEEDVVPASSPPRGTRPPPPPPLLTPMPQIAARGLEGGMNHGMTAGAGMEEFLAKGGMFHFGDVLVDHHPDTAPVPMVVPMVYLVPLSEANGRTNFELHGLQARPQICSWQRNTIGWQIQTIGLKP